MRAPTLALLFLLNTGAAQAQTPPSPPGNESTFAATVRLERKAIAEACVLKKTAFFKCPATLATGKPFHLAVGSMPPGNGVAAGVAFVYHTLTSDFDKSWSADAIVSPNASWRAGLVRQWVFTKPSTIRMVPIGAGSGTTLAPQAHGSFGLFAQGVSFKKIARYDAAGNEAESFSHRQFSGGLQFNAPVGQNSAVSGLDLSIAGDADIRAVTTTGSTNTAAFDNSASFSSLSGHAAIRPRFVDDRLRLHYEAGFRQYIPLTSGFTRFRRVTYGLNHELGLYGVRTLIADSGTVARNDCAGVDGNAPCPITSKTRNQYGSLRISAYASIASAPAGREVPFFLQETLGGTDITGRQGLVAFRDYRFRGPKIASISTAFEHYLYSIVGLAVMAEAGVVADRGQSLRWASRHQSVGAGISLRVGALPVAQFLFAHGSEGNRFVFLIDASLLGGSRRPAIQ